MTPPLSSRRGTGERWWLPLTILLAMVGVFFWRVPAGGVMLAADILYGFDPWRASAPPGFVPNNPNLGDTLDAMYPNVALLAEGFKAGRFPLWNPHTAGGVPLGGLITSGALYPLNVLYVLLPVEVALGPHAMLRTLIAGWFMYLFLRALRLDVGPALLGGVAFAFGGWQMTWLGWPQTYVSVWLPALLWAVERWLQSRRPVYIAAQAGTVALLLLGGFPSVAAYALAAGGVWALYRLASIWWTGRCEPGRSPGTTGGLAVDPAADEPPGNRHRSPERVRLPILGGGLVLGLALGLAVGSPQLATTQENLRESGYEARRIEERAYYADYHLPLPSAVTLILPRYYGDDATLPFWGPLNLVETTGYTGLLPLLLAPLAFGVRRRRGTAIFFAVVAVAALSLVYGIGPVPAVASRLPVFNSSASTRLLLLYDFALAVLAAFGAQALLAQAISRRRAALAVALTLAVLAGALVAVDRFWSSLTDPQAYLRETLGLLLTLPAEPPHPLAGLLRGDTYQATNLATAAVALALSLAALAVAAVASRRSLGSTALIAALFADLWLFGGSLNTVLRPAELPPEPPSVTRLREETRAEGPFRVLNLGTTLLANVPSVWGIDDAGGHDTAHTARFAEVLRLIDPEVDNRRRWGTRLTFSESANVDSPLLDLLGVRYVLGPPAGCDTLGHRPVAHQETGNDVVRDLVAGVEHGQSFVAEGDGLDEVCVMLATHSGRARGPLVFHLRGQPDGPDLVHLSIDAAQVPDNTLYPFRFEPIPNSAGRRFYFSLEAPNGQSGAAATIRTATSDAYAAGERFEQGQPAAGDLWFRALARSPRAWQRIDTPDVAMWRNPSPLPRAFLVDRVEVLPPEQILARLASPDFDPGRVAVVESQPFPLAGAPGPDARTTPRATIAQYTPGDVVISVSREAPALLVFTESYYPGWTAELLSSVPPVAGSPATARSQPPVARVNGAFLGVWLQPGDAAIRLRYTAPALDNGLRLALVGLVALVGLCLLDGWTKRRAKTLPLPAGEGDECPRGRTG